METPSSTRRVTRSQTLAGLNNNNIPISNFEKGLSNSRQRKAKPQQQDRSAFIDITNDSPIVGLAIGGAALETPLSSVAKQRISRAKKTPGSGEALLRGQVKTLLQKVEEEAELSKLSLESRPFLRVKGVVNSPAGLLNPTPANTPQVMNLSGGDHGVNGKSGFSSEAPSPLVEEQLISQVIDEEEESLELHKSIITRSLLLDFSEKSDTNDSSECSSMLTESKEKSTPDDDNSSVWSLQVNASTLSEEDDKEEEEEEDDDYYFEEEGEEVDEVEEEGNDDEMVNELCEFVSKISMNEKKPLPKFEGKHTRFVYNSDDEIVEGEEEKTETACSLSVIRLNGLPTPKGKHLRFLEEEGHE